MASDRPPFEDVYRDYLGRIYAYVRAQVGTSADAEDITAQVFMNAYQAYDRFEPRNCSGRSSTSRRPNTIPPPWRRSESSTARCSCMWLAFPSASATRSRCVIRGSASKRSGTS
ncbi:MAG: hypothetical protein E6I39_13800 [Chloroflexi bacterium]|nr:MAG: hypothetical protein E6I39_13800 [Chloroflexota bacterium]